MSDSSNLFRLLSEIKPDEVYNLAAQSHVGISFEVPEYTAEATGVATIKLLEAVRNANPSARFYQASTSELGDRNVKIGGSDCSGGYQKHFDPFKKI